MPDSMMTVNRHIVIIMDRSGSMASCRRDTEQGLQGFLADQFHEFPTGTIASLYQFDTEYEPVYENVDIADVPLYELTPRGGTALLDAIGRTINAVKAKWKPVAKDQRPDVIVVIVTDGHENSSKEFNAETIKEKIEKRTAKGWTFIYLGANQDAITVAASYGISRDGSMTYDTGNTRSAFTTLSGLVTRGSKGGSYSFTDEDRTSAVE
jgi:uncharacterized protein YegL